jgi:transcriptional regulator with XRE-family HTH domain
MIPHHRTYISILERGLQNPSLRTILSLAAALDVSATSIVQRVEEKLGKRWRREAEGVR